MKKIFSNHHSTLFWLVLSLLQMAQPAHAFVANLEELCSSIHADKTEHSETQSNTLGRGSQLGMILFPKKYIGSVSNNVSVQSYDETIVFTMKPDIENIPDKATIKKNEKKNYKRSRKTQSDIKALLKTKDESDCLSKARLRQMTDQQLVEYGEILKESLLNNELFSANSFLEYADRAAKKFPNGKVIATSEAEKILSEIDALPEGKYNFIFVLHADPTGRLLDFSHFIVERGFFKKVSLKASSISIFSCYPDKVSSYYSKELDYLGRMGVAVYQPVLKKELKKINSTPLNLLESFSAQVAKQMKAVLQ